MQTTEEDFNIAKAATMANFNPKLTQKAKKTIGNPLKVKNVIESSSGKEFTLKITDDLIMKCFAKHSGGPKMKNLPNFKSRNPKQTSNKLETQFENGDTFLHMAIMYQQIELVGYLITKGVDVNIQNDDLNTPLHLAMEMTNTNKEIIQLLLDSKASLEIVNKLNKTAYDLASHEIRKYFGLENKVTIKR